jgi:hypothetical protein
MNVTPAAVTAVSRTGTELVVDCESAAFENIKSQLHSFVADTGATTPDWFLDKCTQLTLGGIIEDARRAVGWLTTFTELACPGSHENRVGTAVDQWRHSRGT